MVNHVKYVRRGGKYLGKHFRKTASANHYSRHSVVADFIGQEKAKGKKVVQEKQEEEIERDLLNIATEALESKLRACQFYGIDSYGARFNLKNFEFRGVGLQYHLDIDPKKNSIDMTIRYPVDQEYGDMVLASLSDGTLFEHTFTHLRKDKQSEQYAMYFGAKTYEKDNLHSQTGMICIDIKELPKSDAEGVLFAKIFWDFFMEPSILLLMDINSVGLEEKREKLREKLKQRKY